jgi:4-amino-4-deoxy-L-arabinose transferase-like glycosyltransferase
VIIGLVVGGWWYLYVRMEDPSTFLQMTKTETSNWSSYNIRPFYYYWSFFVQSGIWTIPALISLLYPFLKSRVSHIKVYKFSLIWTILAVILLSIIPEKKTRYLMPVLIPLAINTGFYIEYLIRTFKDSTEKKVTIPVHLSFGLIALIGILFPLIGFFFGPTLTGLVLLWYLLATLLLGTIGVLMIINLKRKVFKNVFYLSIGFFICAFISVIPMSGIERSSNYNSVSSLNEQNEQNRLKVYSLTSISPEYIWHYGSKISSIKKKDSTYDLPVENTFGLLTRTKDQTIDNNLSKIYEIKYSETFDLNNAELDTKNHRNRLRYHYYILSKK